MTETRTDPIETRRPSPAADPPPPPPPPPLEDDDDKGRQSAHTETKPNQTKSASSSSRRRRPRARSSADDTVETVESHESPDTSRRTLHAGTRTVVVVVVVVVVIVVDIPIIPIVGFGIQTVTTDPPHDGSIDGSMDRWIGGSMGELFEFEFEAGEERMKKPSTMDRGISRISGFGSFGSFDRVGEGRTTIDGSRPVGNARFLRGFIFHFSFFVWCDRDRPTDGPTDRWGSERKRRRERREKW